MKKFVKMLWHEKFVKLFVCLFVCVGPGPCQKIWLNPVEGHPIFQGFSLKPKTVRLSSTPRLGG